MRGANIAIVRPLGNQLEVLPRRSNRTARWAPKCSEEQVQDRDKPRIAGARAIRYLSTGLRR